MLRRVSRFKCLLKLGALGGLAIGVTRFLIRRRSRSQTSESSWPTLAETAAERGQPLDEKDADAGDAGMTADGSDTTATETTDVAEANEPTEASETKEDQSTESIKEAAPTST